MRLFIAEKPAMGREIAKRLPGPHTSKDGYIETPNAIVTWCIGHLLETAPPDAYDARFEKFPGTFDMLPIIPQEWKLQVSGDKGKQVNTIKSLLKRASEVVNAGDPGREGQLIIDELLHFLGNKKPVKRILLNALDDTTIRTELNNLHDNTLFFNLYQAGKGRQQADWLVGMNLSRAYTILGFAGGYRGVLSVGRVQSPTLAIVVRRDEEIKNFIPKDYFTIKALFETQNKESFWANWLPAHSKDLQQQSQGVAPSEEEDEDDDSAAASGGASHQLSWLDESNRIIDAKKAQEIAQKVQGKVAQVILSEATQAQEVQPLPFDLSGMQILCNAKWGASVQETLQACQSLYEKGYLSYPRTDCCYLPENQHSDAAATLQALEQSLPQIRPLIQKANLQIKSRAWNDKKMGEHHAIIPTKSAANLSALSTLEQNIFKTSALRYLAQFYPPAVVDKMKIILLCEQEHFVARGRSIVSSGWQEVYQSQPDALEDKEPKEGKDNDDDTDALLPALRQADSTLCIKSKLDAKQTKPPAHYTQGTLLKAMKMVHTLVSDPAQKKKLKAVEGIGRSATRASIVETLIKRGFLQEKGKQIFSTPVGQALIHALPQKLVDPALTALWESALDLIASGRTTLDAFMQKQQGWLLQLTQEAQSKQSTGIPNLPQGLPSASGKTSGSSHKSSTNKTSSTASKGSTGNPATSSPKSPPKPASAAKGKPCPKCKKGTLMERTVLKDGPNKGKKFWGCNNYPDCKHVDWN